MASSRSPTSTATVIVTAVSLVGVLLLALGGYFFYQSTAFVDRSWPAVGEVVGYVRPGGGATSLTPLTPIVRYQPSQSEVRQLQPSFVATWRGYTVGEKLTVLYDPDNLSDARIDDFWQLWFLPVLSASLGMALVTLPWLALGIAVAGNRRDRQGSG